VHFTEARRSSLMIEQTASRVCWIGLIPPDLSTALNDLAVQG
jgi:hypothetical protein